MSRRIDVELTSTRADGNWTWRAAGALQPKGVVPGSMLPDAARVGDVLRAEIELELDGMTIVGIASPKGATPKVGLLEVAGSKPVVGGVTVTLAGRGSSRKGERGQARNKGGARTGRPSQHGQRQERGLLGERINGSGDQSRPAGQSKRSSTGSRQDQSRSEAAQGSSRPASAGATRTRTSQKERLGENPDHDSSAVGTTGEARHGSRPAKSRQPRLTPGRAHLQALLDSISPAEHTIAKQLADGGMPAVRKALATDRDAAKEGGREVPQGHGILELAEKLSPVVREALWRDRADAALAAIEHISLRDLRSTVTGAAPRDESGRVILQSLRDALTERVQRLRTSWEQDITHSLDEHRVLQAVRLSARPPEPTAKFPAGLVTRLAEAVGTAMTAQTTPDRWLALLEAAVASPVRRIVKPAGVPDDRDLKLAAAKEAGRIPALASLLGLAMPPPPGPPIPPPPPKHAPRSQRTTSTTRPRSGQTVESAPEAPAVADPPGDQAPVGQDAAVGEPQVADALIVANPVMPDPADTSPPESLEATNAPDNSDVITGEANVEIEPITTVANDLVSEQGDTASET